MAGNSNPFVTATKNPQKFKPPYMTASKNPQNFLLRLGYLYSVTNSGQDVTYSGGRSAPLAML